MLPIDKKQKSWLDRFWLPAIVVGMVNSLRHFFFKKAFTTRYPEERLPYNPRLRGEHILKTDEQGREKCVACMLCQAACPAKCIHIVPGPAPAAWTDRERVPAVFEIDELRCIYCGYCEEACPCDAIELTPKIYKPSYSREEKIYTKEKLLNNAPQKDYRRQKQVLAPEDKGGIPREKQSPRGEPWRKPEQEV